MAGAVPDTPTPIEERIWPKLWVTQSGCWVFDGSRDPKGYGRIWCSRQRRPLMVHRVVFEHVVGLIRPGFVLDHLCRNHGCCNPAHLEPVTNRENVRRGLSGLMVTHCPKGHEYTEANTYTRKGSRQCRTCRRERERTRRRRRSLAVAVA